MKNLLFTILAVMTISVTQKAQAGVFNIPEFVEYKGWAVGLEPEATLSTFGNTSNSGIGINAKFTYGATPLSNLQIGIGSGSGSKEFRIGGTYAIDFIPDLEGQIGAGLAFQAYYFKLKGALSQTETTLYPYVHKMQTSETGLKYDPYVAMPFGVAFYNSNYRSIWQAVFGCYFKPTTHYGINSELGLNLKDTDTYVSAGVTYRD